MAFVIAFAITMSIQTQRIADERDRATKETEVAEKVNQFMLDVFAAAEPYSNPNGHGSHSNANCSNAGRAVFRENSVSNRKCEHAC